MKRKHSPSDNSTGEPSSVTKRLDKRKGREGQLDEQLLRFSCKDVDINITSPTMPIDNSFRDIILNAMNNYTHSFNESIKSTVKFLEKHKIHVVRKNMDENINIMMVTSPIQYLVGVLNGKFENSFVLHSDRHPNLTAIPKDMLLLYAFSQVYGYTIYCFSSRSKPAIIHPNNKHRQDRSLPYFGVLKSINSYTGTVEWFGLELKNRPKDMSGDTTPTSEIPKNIVAKKRASDEKKPRAKRQSVSSVIDDKIIRLLVEETNTLYQKKWSKFKIDKHKTLSENIQKFSSTLSTKQFPTGSAGIVKTKIEQLIRQNHFPTVKLEDIPTSALWVQQKINRLKQNGKISIDKCISDFIMGLNLESSIQDSAPEDTDTAIDENDDQDVEDNAYRTVSRSLKRVINKDLDYSIFLKKLEDLQEICDKCCSGLSKATEILVDGITSGDILPSRERTFFDFQFIDLPSLKIETGEEKIAIIDDSDETFLKQSDIFTFEGFWKLLSSSVGRKKPHEYKHPVIDYVSRKISSENYCDFTTTPTLVSACKQFFTNFSNMWTYQRFVSDLRVTLTLILRLHLCPKKSHRLSHPHASKKQKQNSQKSLKTVKKRHQKRVMIDLFDAIAKYNAGKLNKIHVVEKLIDGVFNFCERGRSDLEPPVNKDDNSNEFEEDAEDFNEIDEDLVIIDNVTELDTNDNDVKDLSAKEIKALCAVCTMLITSPSIEGNVDAAYIKKQLYYDKQESIPAHALDTSARIVNKLRLISCKKDEKNAFRFFQMRKIRNSLVKFIGPTGTRFKENRMFPKKIEEKQKMSINVDTRTLYLLFAKEYNIFKLDGVNMFTSSATIKSIEDKKAVFSNFFNLNMIERIIQEQKLTPMYSFKFCHKYSLNFLGYKNLQTEEVPHVTSTSSFTSLDSNTENRKLKVERLHKEIKEEKALQVRLSKNVREIENTRMDLGQTFRKNQKLGTMTCDSDLYRNLKTSRKECNAIYSQLLSLNKSIKTKSSEMYCLNKGIHNQNEPTPTAGICLSEKSQNSIISGQAIIQGLDPGVVTTASISATKSSSMFQSINRYSALESLENCDHDVENEVTFELTAKRVNSAILDTKHVIQRQRKIKNKKELTPSYLNQRQVTRSIRLKRYYQHLHSSYRQKLFRLLGNSEEA
ncbi:uncharacterized protein EV154DRAFT_576986 [Mucor mucedo]|uniref:uncharacterized protein n=1 Tax=Mucor mucedo TaxID=29922 RepID=UPI0022211452|nr:uncharacterized protein EV154DRAFT_576986 [Mucor mucedo]KAI7877097.1 hypothetical protein EV154DRAFT_576986 [Mucor mucedo]